MKCSNCYSDIISSFNCKYCNQNFCSFICLELHFSKIHQKNTSIPSSHPTKINSPYLLYGFLNNSISYDSFYSLKNFAPIFDEYGKVKVIGSGSYGQVYLALHTINKKCYAIKHMDKKKLYSLLHSLSSIQKEIDIQSKIDHPNIVKLLFVKETNFSYDLIMEYASDGSLFHYIRKYKGLNENKSFSLFIQVVNAINFLHQNDLIHRDIKPENLLMYENNIVKLCDFGWCVKLDGQQRGTFCGTTEYMSPELVNHEGYGKEIDVWSLGVLLYEMIHGYSPFRPNKPKFNEKDVMENIKNHNLIFNKRVSNECKELIYHLLDPNINMRYKVEDIYNSSFVKRYELLNYNYPDKNLVLHYNKALIQNNIYNTNIDKNKENINTNNINTVTYQEISSNIELNNNKNSSIHNSIDSLIYSINNNNQIEENKNLYNDNFNHIKSRNLSPNSLNKGLYSEIISFINKNNNEIINNANISNNIYANYSLKNKDIIINDEDYIFEYEKNTEKENENKILINKTAKNFYSLNNEKNREEDIINIYHAENSNSNNVEKVPQDNKRDNKQFIDFNSNQFLFLTGKNQNNNKIIDKNINEVNNIWNNDTNNDINNINNIINTQYIPVEQPKYYNSNNNILNEEIANKLLSNINKPNNSNQNIDNNINYNYYYNFNNYNNNFTNNFFNNSYNPLSNNLIKKSTLLNNNNNNSNNNSINVNINYNNSSISNNCIIDKNKTPSTIPTTSNKNIIENKNYNVNYLKENQISKKNVEKKKISEFEVGEDIYNLSEKDQNECETSSIKININKDSQKINNRKYLSKSDYSIMNKKQKNNENKKTLINFYNNSHKNISNSKNNRLKEEGVSNLKQKSIQKKISAIDLKNKNNLEKEIVYYNKDKTKNKIINEDKDKIPILDEKRDNIKIHEIKVAHMSIPYPKTNTYKSPNNNEQTQNNLVQNQIKSKSYYGKNDNNFIVEINNKIINRNNNKSNENKANIINKINKEKKDYIKVLKEGNLNKKKDKIFIKKDNNNYLNNNFLGDVICSIFNAFDSKKDEKSEINILNKENKYNKNTSHITKKNNLMNKEVMNPKSFNLRQRNNSFIKMSLSPNPRKEPNNNNKETTTPIKSSFIKINSNNNKNNNNQKILNLGNVHMENSHSASNINKYKKINIISNTQPNSNSNSINININDVKRGNRNYQLLKPSISSNHINRKDRRKINANNQFGKDKNINLKEIPIIIKDRNKNNEDNSNLGDSKIITPKKRYIFNRVNPIKLLGAFKKELTIFSKKEQFLKANRNKK